MERWSQPLWLSNANSWPGENYLFEKIQETVSKLREICKEFNVLVTSSQPKPNNVVPLSNAHVPPKVQLRSGTMFDYTDIKHMLFDIEDIAHALSNMCRFNGHTNKFYSVAQHSVLVSELVPEEHALAALLHDAAEAYCGDMVSPLKQLLPVYQSIHTTIEQNLYRSVGVEWPVHACVKDADVKTSYRGARPNDTSPCSLGIH